MKLVPTLFLFAMRMVTFAMLVGAIQFAVRMELRGETWREDVGLIVLLLMAALFSLVVERVGKRL